MRVCLGNHYFKVSTNVYVYESEQWFFKSFHFTNKNFMDPVRELLTGP